MTSYSQGWHPPAPSLVSLPVDITKTEPKPAFYKLQFGDDVTGFNYYVRTTTVVIGRNCVSLGLSLLYGRILGEADLKDMKGAPLPPPDERHLGGPTKPPLEFEDLKPDLGLAFGLDGPLLDENLDAGGDVGMDMPLTNGDSVEGLDETSVARDLTPAVQPMDVVQEGLQATPIENVVTETLALPTIPPLARTSSEDQIEIKVEQPEPPIADTHTASSAPPESSDALVSPHLPQRPLSAPPTSDADKVDMTIFDSLDPEALEALVLAATSDSPPISTIAPPPPPPPIRRASDTLEHVDVDLGPLKSVSRNHAKISYFADLGHFCLEILGRNGAWVDDRYFVRGSTVPLNQG